MGIVGGNICLFEREKYWSSQSETSCQDSVTWSKISPKVQLVEPHLQDAGHYRRPQWDSAGEKWLNCENGGKVTQGWLIVKVRGGYDDFPGSQREEDQRNEFRFWNLFVQVQTQIQIRMLAHLLKTFVTAPLMRSLVGMWNRAALAGHLNLPLFGVSSSGFLRSSCGSEFLTSKG